MNYSTGSMGPCYELILNAQTCSTKVYPLTPVKQKQLDEFLDENLKSRQICSLKSPMASLVFFIKKTDESLWIRPLVRMRNAVEHPGGRSGTLHVENFTAEVVASTIMVLEPVWYLNNDEKSPIVRDMGVFTDNLLTLCEQTLILCLEKFKKNFPIVIAEAAKAELVIWKSAGVRPR